MGPGRRHGRDTNTSFAVGSRYPPPGGLLESHQSIVQRSRSSLRLSGIPTAEDALRFIDRAAQLNAQAVPDTGATKRLAAHRFKGFAIQSSAQADAPGTPAMPAARGAGVVPVVAPVVTWAASAGMAQEASAWGTVVPDLPGASAASMKAATKNPDAVLAASMHVPPAIENTARPRCASGHCARAQVPGAHQAGRAASTGVAMLPRALPDTHSVTLTSALGDRRSAAVQGVSVPRPAVHQLREPTERREAAAAARRTDVRPRRRPTAHARGQQPPQPPDLRLPIHLSLIHI